MSDEGWTWLQNSPKWHYFRDGRSLCSKWGLWGNLKFAETENLDSPDNCKACATKRRKELAGLLP